MSHIHNIIDTDSHFVIDPITRAITTKSDKLVITQFDHDSERFTFQIPRYVEEHDMSLCDRIEIHYTNIIRTKKEQRDDVYIVTDTSSDHDTVFFEWLVSRNATQLVGTLKFSISFICLDDEGNVIYEWGTDKFENVQVLEKINNTETVKEMYPDLYEQLKQEVLASSVPKQTTITLLSTDWVEADGVYSQVVELEGVTANSKVDLQPSPDQLNRLIDDGVSMTTLNDNGVVTVFAFGAAPEIDMTMPVLVTEVSV